MNPPNCYELLRDSPVRLNDLANLELCNSSFTIMCWVKVHDHSKKNYEQYDNTIIGQDNCQMNRCLHIVIRSGKLYFGFYGADSQGNTPIVAGQWYHTAFTYDSASGCQSIYLNGVLDGFASGIPPLGASSDCFSLSQYASSRPLNGRLSGLRVFPGFAIPVENILLGLHEKMECTIIDSSEMSDTLVVATTVGDGEYLEAVLHSSDRMTKVFDENLEALRPMDYVLK